MLRQLKALYHVNNVPWFLKPLFHLYGYGLAGLHVIYCRFVFRTSRFEFQGAEALVGRGNFIFCLWHYAWHSYFIAFSPWSRTPGRPSSAKHVWMNHPLWYMQPVHVMVDWLGVHEQV